MPEWAARVTAESGEAGFLRSAFRIDRKIKRLKHFFKMFCWPCISV